MLSNHLTLYHPLLLPPSVFPSIRVFSSESVLHIRWPKYWSLSFSISPSNEYPGLISFRINCLDLLEVQGTLKSLLQHHSSKASVLQCSAFFIVQLSHSNVTTGKTIALTIRTFVSKVMSLLFNMLSRLVIAFLLRSQGSFNFVAVPSDFGVQEDKICCCFHFFPFYSPSSDGTGCHDLSFLTLIFKPAFSFSCFTFFKRLFSSSLLSAIKVVSSAYLRLLVFLPAILIPACASSSQAFHVIYSAYKLNKQGDSIQS